MKKKIKDMEEMLSGMRMEKKGGVTAIIGGLTACDDMEEAVGFLKEKLGATINDEILETYFKGDVFKGLIFMKFTDPKFLKLAINRIQAGHFKHNDHFVWMNEDKELHERAPAALMFGLKKQLFEWGFSKKDIRIIEDEGVMKVAGETVLKTTIMNNELILQWFGTWTEWVDLHDSDELKVLKEKYESDMKGTGSKGSPGKGKWSE